MNEQNTTRTKLVLAFLGFALMMHAVYTTLSVLEAMTLKLTLGYCIILLSTGLGVSVLMLRK